MYILLHLSAYIPLGANLFRFERPFHVTANLSIYTWFIIDEKGVFYTGIYVRSFQSKSECANQYASWAWRTKELKLVKYLPFLLQLLVIFRNGTHFRFMIVDAFSESASKLDIKCHFEKKLRIKSPFILLHLLNCFTLLHPFK